MLNLTGDDPSQMQYEIPLRVEIEDGGTCRCDYVKIRDCGLPLLHRKGRLEIGTLDCARFTADLFNSHGDLKITNLIVDFDSDFEHSDEYHADALGQFFSEKTGGRCGNVKIKNIFARIRGEDVQGMMLSETDNYHDFHIGYGDVDIEIDYPFAFVANTLQDSYINMGDNGIKILKRKKSKYRSKRVFVENYSDDQELQLDDGVDVIRREL